MPRPRRQCSIREVGEGEEVPSDMPTVRGRAASPPPPRRARQNSSYSKEHKEYALKLLSKGVSYRAISERTGIPRSTIVRWHGN